MFLENGQSFGLQVGVADMEMSEVAIYGLIVVDLLGDVVESYQQFPISMQLGLFHLGDMLLNFERKANEPLPALLDLFLFLTINDSFSIGCLVADKFVGSVLRRRWGSDW